MCFQCLYMYYSTDFNSPLTQTENFSSEDSVHFIKMLPNLSMYKHFYIPNGLDLEHELPQTQCTCSGMNNL